MQTILLQVKKDSDARLLLELAERLGAIIVSRAEESEAKKAASATKKRQAARRRLVKTVEKHRAEATGFAPDEVIEEAVLTARMKVFGSKF